MDDDHFCLSEVALFRDLSRREMAAMAEAAPMRTVPPGEIVYDPTRPVSVLFIVKRGRFRLFRTAADGHAVTTALPGPGAIFGEMDMLGLKMRGTWAEALDGGDLCLMSRADVRHMLLSDARIATRIAEQLGARIADLEDRLADMACKSVLERVAHRLCVLAAPVPPGADAETVRLTHGQLAGLIGATRERTTTVLGELAQHGLVSLHRGRIRIRDRAGLAAVADGAARTPHRPGGPPRAGDGSLRP
ncbi:Crp/Fnr family transcriptional regulator [Pseudonocardia sp. DSM 110487]|uniref:Crp/Fnr family transcriptional regulator n=1 Tax=Pseudonocardia sp. DSM 110487 TaxID=2865833 RepID=UPI001C6A7A4D|nr:Crp/Fnr family transcriptional regulator [Pseudonocardia sp. DSM 110487]QYN37704.1 Crp/Fnr family transcriptional regulator [Pseudonocardia sp. DSM 110487]